MRCCEQVEKVWCHDCGKRYPARVEWNTGEVWASVECGGCGQLRPIDHRHGGEWAE